MHMLLLSLKGLLARYQVLRGMHFFEIKLIRIAIVIVVNSAYSSNNINTMSITGNSS